MKIVICGLSITSSWGNGHATTYRALIRALRARGHDIAFFERDLEWYASNRDMPEPPFCRVHIYEHWQDIANLLRRELVEADVAMVGSFFPDGIKAVDAMLDSGSGVKAFYDIDTPITVSKLRAGRCRISPPRSDSGLQPVLQLHRRSYAARVADPLRRQARGPTLLLFRS